MAAVAVVERASTWPSQIAEQPIVAPAAMPSNASDIRAARAYGERAARLAGFAGRPWQDIAPLLRAGWEARHAEICPAEARHDWRLSWPAVREGWRAAGGRDVDHPGPHEERGR